MSTELHGVTTWKASSSQSPLWESQIQHRNEASLKGREFLENVGDYQYVKKDADQRSYLLAEFHTNTARIYKFRLGSLIYTDKEFLNRPPHN
jgi:hypothetical protein